MIIASTKIENENSNWSALTVLKNEPRNVPAMPPQRRADRVGEQLHAHGRDAHRDGGDLVLADRDPRPADARVAQPEVDEQDDQRERRARSSTTV